MIINKISKKFRRIGNKHLSELENHLRERKLFSMVEEKLSGWLSEGKHHEKNAGIEEVAEELGLTRTELTSFFSRKHHTTFMSWRTAMRIEEARALMDRDPQMPLSRIANMVGIDDKSDFRHQFKKAVGCTPSEYRKKKKKSPKDLE